ncbi:PD-(D/E)XK nuclease family protein [Candidatus Bipolaricaulota bacterium]|nr:PD-(D/E)XK nuclease family protein [Candidatus Bipolaricaulota bacterium]
MSLERLSYSRLERFASCPYSFYLRYLVGLPEPHNKNLERGRLAHELIARGLSGKDPQREAAELAPRYVSLEEKDAAEAADMACWFLASYRPAPGYRAEYAIEDAVGGAPFVAILDLVEPDGDGGLVVTDFKTDWQPYNPTDKMQLPLYAYFAARHFRAKKVRMRLWFLRCRRDPVREEPATPEAVRSALSWVRDLVARIKEAEELPGALGFPPAPGKACEACGHAYSLRCLAETLSGRPDPGDDPAALAALAVRLERALEDVKEKMKAHIRATGQPIEIGGQFYDFYPKSTWEFPDVRQFADVLAGAGEDPWKYLRVDGWELKRLFKRKPGLEPVVRSIGEEKAETYFSRRGRPAAEFLEKEGGPRP